jgi:hypothetical protein
LRTVSPGICAPGLPLLLVLLDATGCGVHLAARDAGAGSDAAQDEDRQDELLEPAHEPLTPRRRLRGELRDEVEDGLGPIHCCGAHVPLSSGLILNNSKGKQGSWDLPPPICFFVLLAGTFCQLALATYISFRITVFFAVNFIT